MAQAQDIDIKATLARLEALGDERSGRRTASTAPTTISSVSGSATSASSPRSSRADHESALTLWDTGNIDARLLAILLMKPQESVQR